MIYDKFLYKAFKVEIKHKKISAKQFYLTDYELSNRDYEEHSVCIYEENLQEYSENLIVKEIDVLKKELNHLNLIFDNTSPIVSLIIKKKWFKLFIFKNKETIKNIKKHYVRKRFLQKKIDTLHEILKSIPLSIEKTLIKDLPFVFNDTKNHQEIIKNGFCYMLKIVNNDNEFRSFINIKKPDIIPTKVITTDTQHLITLSVNENKGSEYTDLINISSINPDGTVLGSKKIIKQNKTELYDFLTKWKENFDKDFNLMIKSID